jgi:drug/metabolite transporter (DMT)-like permease
MTHVTLRHASLAGPGAATAGIVAASVCFGLVPLFARELQAAGMADAAIAFSRYAFSTLVLLPFLPRARAKRGPAAIMVGTGVLMSLGWLGYLDALRTLPVASAGVIYMSYPLFALLLGWLLAGAAVGWRGWLAGAMILGGAALLAEGGALAGAGPLALLKALTAPLTFGLGIVILSSFMNGLTAPERMVCATLGAVLGMTPLLIATPVAGFLPASGAGWLMVAGLALATALIPQMLYVSAAPRVGPGRAAAAGSVELPTMLAIGALAFGEVLGPREIAAAALVLAAILTAPAVRPGAPGLTGRKRLFGL